MDEVRPIDGLAAAWPKELTAKERVRRSFAAYSRPLTQFLVAMGLPLESAQDVVQDTFIAYLEELEKGVEVVLVRPWLFRVSSRIAIKRLRQLRSEVGYDPGALIDLLDQKRRAEASGEHSVWQQQRERELLAAIESLSPQQKLCLHLRSEGLKYREIAEVLDVSIPTVAEFLRRAIERLRSILDA